MLTAAELKSVLAAYGLRLTKRRGQHYLVDAGVIERFLRLCPVGSRDTVVDIGAGLGALSEPLAARAGRVIAVDVDTGICAALAQRLERLSNVRVVCQDILTFSWDTVPEAVVVGAIPYQITSPLLVSLTEHRAGIKEAWLLLQREVGQRMHAQPGTKAYGRLSILCQYGWEVSVAFHVPPSAFFPQPSVDSSWLRLIPRRQPAVTVPDEAAFFSLVKAGFGQRRKTLVNGLISGGLAKRPQAEAVVRRLNWPAGIRAEQLSLQQLAALADILYSRKPW